MKPIAIDNIFEQPTVHGEVAPAPAAPLPAVPAPPVGFTAPQWPTEDDARDGASALGTG